MIALPVWPQGLLPTRHEALTATKPFKGVFFCGYLAGLWCHPASLWEAMGICGCKEDRDKEGDSKSLVGMHSRLFLEFSPNLDPCYYVL